MKTILRLLKKSILVEWKRYKLELRTSFFSPSTLVFIKLKLFSICLTSITIWRQNSLVKVVIEINQQETLHDLSFVLVWDASVKCTCSLRKLMYSWRIWSHHLRSQHSACDVESFKLMATLQTNWKKLISTKKDLIYMELVNTNWINNCKWNSLLFFNFRSKYKTFL